MTTDSRCIDGGEHDAADTNALQGLYLALQSGNLLYRLRAADCGTQGPIRALLYAGSGPGLPGHAGSGGVFR